MKTVGIVGAGNMASAMARGWAAGEAGPDLILITDSGSGRAAKLAAEVGGEAVGSNAELAERAELIVLASKPAALDAVAAEIASAGKPVLSVLGAVSLERLGAALPGVPVIRTMPNIAVELRRGVVCWSAAESVQEPVRERVRELLGALGTPIELDDSLIDPATAVMGCSPAYLALFAETLTDAAIREGVPEHEAWLMVNETLAGTAAVLEQRDPADLRRAVASPGGSTEAGLEALESGALKETLESAIRASLGRMRE